MPDAYPTLRAALAAEQNTPGHVVINVWSETQYAPSSTSPARDQYLKLRSDLEIVGGWEIPAGGSTPVAGTTSTEYPSATWGQNTTFYAGGTVISGTGGGVDSFTVMAGMYLDNVTLQYLSFQNLNNFPQSGDPPYIWPAGSVFIGGSTGVTIKNCDFMNNRADRNPAGLDCNYTDMTVSECFFYNNDDEAFYVTDGNTRFETSVFYSNHGYIEGGAGVFLEVETAQITDCTFWANSAGLWGGALSIGGGQVDTSVSRFKSNVAEKGGGVFIFPEVTTAAVNIASSSFFGNTSKGTISELVPSGQGGGVWAAGDVLIANCSFKDNYADTGGAMYFATGTTDVHNTIAWHNEDSGGINTFGSAIAFNTSSPPTPPTLSILYSDISSIPGTYGSTNFSLDPLFPSPATDFDPTGPLGLSSPCINTGNDSLVPADGADSDGDANLTEVLPLDVEALARIHGRVDRGSHEADGCPCFQDYNHDGDFGTDQDIEAFFLCLAGNCCPACPEPDINCDGDVGTDQDIELFFIELAGGGPCG